MLYLSSHQNDLSKYFEITAEPDPKIMGPNLKAASGPVREKLLEYDPRELAALARGGVLKVEVDGGVYELTEDYFRYHEVLGDRWVHGEEGDLEVLLDLELTDDLRKEGIAREVVRRIQTMRKDMDLQYDARINLKINGDPIIIEGIDAFRDYITTETLSDSLTLEKEVNGREWEIDQGNFTVLIEKS